MNFSILFGGASYEHEISIVSAIALKKVLNHVSHFLFLDADGTLYEIGADNMRSDTFSTGAFRKEPKLFLTKGGFEKKTLWGTKRLENIGTVINLVHGAQGEDGTIAALLDFYDIPYIGPRLEGSVVSFDKWLTKLYAEGVEVLTVDYQKLSIDDERRIDFDYPVIVKPCRLGSSIGVGVVRDQEALDYALDVAFEFDEEVLIEPFIEGIVEYNVAGCKVGDEWIFGRIERPEKREFLDFEQKYLDFSRTESVGQADIDPTLADELKETFKKVYANIFEGALVRCDFFFASSEIMLNEINPIPGSMANYLFDDFEAVLSTLAKHLPQKRAIRPDYAYIDKVQSAKGPKNGGRR